MRRNGGIPLKRGERELVAGWLVAAKEPEGEPIRPCLSPTMYEVQDGQGFRHRSDVRRLPGGTGGRGSYVVASLPLTGAGSVLSRSPTSDRYSVLSSVELV